MTNTTVLISHWRDANNDGMEGRISHCRLTTQETAPIMIDQSEGKKKKNALIDRICREIIPTIKWRQKAIQRNFLNDFFFGCAFIYPIQGLFEILTHKIYWRQLGVFALSYSAIFLTIGTVYYVAIFPALLAWAMMTLGPLGFILAHVQWVLQTNALTAIVCRKIILTYISNQIFDTTLYLHGQGKFLTKAKFIIVSSNCDNFNNQIHWYLPEFWITVVPIWSFNILKKILVACTLASISLIPLIGPTVVNQLISSRRAHSYMNRYFILNGMHSKAIKEYEYERLGLFFSFGMAAGALEFLPVFSIITIMSNIIGAARWSVDIIENKRP